MKQTNFVPDQFEIVYRGSLSDVTNGRHVIVIREKQAEQSAGGGWVRAYGFADGHSEVHSEMDGNFDRWEEQQRQQSGGH